LSFPKRNKNKVWTSGISLVGFVLEVFDSREIFSKCVDKYDQNQRIIQFQGESHIYLSPSGFERMLKLPDLTIVFNGDESRSLLKERNNGLELLHK